MFLHINQILSFFLKDLHLKKNKKTLLHFQLLTSRKFQNESDKSLQVFNYLIAISRHCVHAGKKNSILMNHFERNILFLKILTEGRSSNEQNWTGSSNS